MKGTIDEDVMKALENKNKTQAALIDAVKANGRVDVIECHYQNLLRLIQE